MPDVFLLEINLVKRASTINNFGAIAFIFLFVTALSPCPGVDLIPFTATMIACLLLGLDWGIVVGIAVNLCFIMYATARPSTTVRPLLVDAASDDGTSTTSTTNGAATVSMLLVQPDQSLVFSAAEHLRAKVLRSVQRALANGYRFEAYADETPVAHNHAEKAPLGVDAVHPTTIDIISGSAATDQHPSLPLPSATDRIGGGLVVVLDGRHVRTIDITVARNLLEMHVDLLGMHDVRLVFWRWPRQPEAVAWRLSTELGACFWAGERRLEQVAERCWRERLAAERQGWSV